MTLQDIYTKADLTPLLEFGRILAIGYLFLQIVGLMIGLGIFIWVMRGFTKGER